MHEVDGLALWPEVPSRPKSWEVSGQHHVVLILGEGCLDVILDALPIVDDFILEAGVDCFIF